MKTRTAKFLLCISVAFALVLCLAACMGKSECSETGDAHSFGEWSADTASCTVGGTQQRACTACGHTETRNTEPLGHDDVTYTAKAPTCLEAGHSAYTCCWRCGYGESEKTVSALGHDMVSVAAKAPTCTEEGYEAHTACSRCNFSEDKEEIAPLGHDSVFNAAVASTCSEKGHKSYVTCSRCDYSTPYIETALIEHSLGDWYGNTATCTESGLERRDCVNCTYSETRETESLGHALVAMEGHAATCTTGGYTPYVDCSRCDYTTKNEVGPLGHTPGNWSADNATCTVAGEVYRICSVCGDESTKETMTTEPLGHTYGEPMGDTATCEAAGIAIKTCTVCGHEKEVETVALGHDPGDSSFGHTTATCTADGKEYVKCIREGCDHTYAERAVAALGHNYKEICTATCTEAGVTYQQCSRCDDVPVDENGVPIEEATEALGHQGEWSGNTATCSNKGTETRTCTVCALTETRETEALAHTYIDVEAKEPSCIETGYTAHKKCAVCGAKDETYSELSTTDHTNIELGERAATCDVGGWVGQLLYCTVCQTQTVESLIPATGHSFGDDGICATCGDYKSSEGLEYTLAEDGLSYIVTGIGTCTDTDIVIPSGYESLPVSAIGADAFASCTAVTSIRIQGNVETIDSSALRFCISLTSIFVGESNANFISIDGNLYSKDGKTLIKYAVGNEATEFTVPAGVTAVEFGAFSFAQNLTTINLGDEVVTIGDYAFHYATSLTTLNIGTSVTSIGNYAFSACKALTAVVIPDNVTALGEGAFNQCTALVSAELGDGLTVVSSELFYGCSLLNSVSFGSSVTKINNGAFYQCASLTSIVIPEGVTTINTSAFAYCTALEKVVLPTTLSMISNYAFYKSDSVVVYYAGSEMEVGSMYIDNTNESLNKEEFHYYSESDPGTYGNAWHYDAEGNIVLWTAPEVTDGTDTGTDTGSTDTGSTDESGAV